MLRELARHGGEIATGSLVARTGLAQSSVREALISLRAAGLIEAVGSGRTQLFRLPESHPLAPAITHLFEEEEARFETVLAGIRSAAERCPGIISVWIYGSVARGEDRADSDLDIAVVTQPELSSDVAEMLRDALGTVEDALGFHSSITVIDARDALRLSRERDPWWLASTRDHIPVAGERPDTLPAWVSRRDAQARRRAG